MNKIIFLTLFSLTTLLAIEIPIEQATQRAFGKSIKLNAKVIQLSNAQQSIMALVSGHIEKYYVGPGEKVKAGQKIALIESIALSKMTAEYVSLKKQFVALKKNYEATKKLYEKGMTSMQDLNLQSMQKSAMVAQISALESQLKTLGIETATLKKASADYILYAHSDGKVSQLIQPLHSVVSEDTALISIVKDQAFYIQSYLPLEYANVVKVGQKLVVMYDQREITTHITQILPELDEKTQRIIVLSSIEEQEKNLYVNTYVPATLYFEANEKYVAINKSALSFFNNEWVVFVPKVDREVAEENTKHNDEHEEQDEDEAHEVPYEARVIEIITSDDIYVGVKGIEEHEAYVNDKSYYVKSMLLKSSLGDGD